MVILSSKAVSSRVLLIGINPVLLIGVFVLFLLGIPQVIINKTATTSSHDQTNSIESLRSSRLLRTSSSHDNMDHRELAFDDNGYQTNSNYVFYDDAYNYEEDDTTDDRYHQDDDTADDDYETTDDYLYITGPKSIDCKKLVVAKEDIPNIRLGFLGNSIIYYNDCPHIVHQMLLESNIQSDEDTCVQGGATFLELFDEGCGLKPSFYPNPYTYQDIDNNKKCYEQKIDHVKTFLHQYDNNKDDGYDYIIMNDQSQNPARVISRADTMWSIKHQYGPVWPINTKTGKQSIPILIQTAAYRLRGKGVTLDLGDFDTFTQSLKDGYTQYQDIFNEKVFDGSKTKALIAPVGDAYQILRNTNEKLWEKLYDFDDYHPSIYGTYLQSCIIYMIITKKMPPSYNKKWWDNARHVIQSPQYPTVEEAKILMNTAAQVLGLMLKSKSSDQVVKKTEKLNDTTIMNNGSKQENTNKNNKNTVKNSNNKKSTSTTSNIVKMNDNNNDLDNGINQNDISTVKKTNNNHNV